MFGIQYHHKKGGKNGNSRGFLMMYAILFITVVLTISIEILNLSLKRLTVSSIGEESARALSAADAGMECALYLDLYKGYFSTSTPTTTYTNICDTNDITIIPPTDLSTSPLVWEVNPANQQQPLPGSGLSFQVRFDSGKNIMCANVYIVKNIFTSGVNKNAIKSTIVRSYGYNTDCPGSAPQRLPVTERRIRTSY